jgi:hypothetical protein
MVATEIRQGNIEPAVDEGKYNPAREWLFPLNQLMLLRTAIEFLFHEPEVNDDISPPAPHTNELDAFADHVQKLP